MGLRFFDAQKEKGDAGRLAVKLEYLIIAIAILMIPSFVSVSSAVLVALRVIIGYGILVVGFIGAYKLHEVLILIFFIIEIIQAILTGIALIVVALALSVVVAAKTFEQNNTTYYNSSDIQATYNYLITVLAVSLVFIIISFVLEIIACVWSWNLRTLIQKNPPQSSPATQEMPAIAD